ncbi:MAG: DMT family transporter [Thermoplasmata archaeon]|nr:MAG: DMT family transporter [Thermoplasmata archaeon]
MTFTDTYALLLASIMWALSFPFIKLGLEYYPPIMMGALRYFFGALPLILFFILRKDSLEDTKKLFKSHWKFIFAIGIFMVTIPNIAQNIGMQYTTASLSTLIQTVGPVFTVILAIILLKESAAAYKILGTILALTCTIILIFHQGVDFGGNNLVLIGNILQFITAISYGINAIFSKVAVEKVQPFLLVGWSMFVGAVILVPISLLTESQNWTQSLNIQALWVMGFLVIFPATIATSLWYWVLQRYEISKQVLFIYLLPFIAIIFSYILLGEVVSFIAIILGILTILGVAIAQKK